MVFIALLVGGVLALGMTLVAIRRMPGLPRPRAVRAGLIILLVLGVGYAMHIRPWLPEYTWYGGQLWETYNNELMAIAARYVSPVIFWLAAAGAGAVLWRRRIFSAQTLLVVFVASVAAIVFWKYTTARVYPVALRRLLPEVLPGTMLLGAYGITRLAQHARWRRIAVAIAGVAAALLLGVSGPYWFEREAPGTWDFVQELADRLPADAVTLFEPTGADSIAGWFAAPLWSLHDRRALLLNQGPLDAQVLEWGAGASGSRKTAPFISWRKRIRRSGGPAHSRASLRGRSRGNRASSGNPSSSHRSCGASISDFRSIVCPPLPVRASGVRRCVSPSPSTNSRPKAWAGPRSTPGAWRARWWPWGTMFTSSIRWASMSPAEAQIERRRHPACGACPCRTAGAPKNPAAQYWHTFRDTAIEVRISALPGRNAARHRSFPARPGRFSALDRPGGGPAARHDAARLLVFLRQQPVDPPGPSELCGGPQVGLELRGLRHRPRRSGRLRVLRPLVALPFAYRNAYLRRLVAGIDRFIAPSHFLRATSMSARASRPSASRCWKTAWT